VEATKDKVGELEFGRESEFFQANGARLIDGPRLEFKSNYYEVTIGDSVLKLVEHASDIHAPILIGLIRSDKAFWVRYRLWDDQVPFRADLFAKPSGVETQDTK
jgi:hypothetical protein